MVEVGDGLRVGTHAAVGREQAPARVEDVSSRLRVVRRRVVAPALEQREDRESVAPHRPAERVTDDALAPQLTEVPVVGDVVIVEHHVRRNVRERATDLADTRGVREDARRLVLRFTPRIRQTLTIERLQVLSEPEAPPSPPDPVGGWTARGRGLRAVAARAS